MRPERNRSCSDPKEFRNKGVLLEAGVIPGFSLGTAPYKNRVRSLDRGSLGGSEALGGGRVPCETGAESGWGGRGKGGRRVARRK